MKNYSLYELNEYIRRIMALNFKDKLWVNGEISQIKESRGHYYLNLIQKSEEEGMVVAESQATIWQRDYRRLQRKFRKKLDGILQEGVSVLVQVRVDFHERYGLKLVIEDIDPAYTLGKVEMERRVAIEQLEALQLMELNQMIPLPTVVQKVALITSEQAAGFQDYIYQLQENSYGYQFRNFLHPATVQGIKAEQEILNQLKRISRNKEQYDCVVIIRGGGARLDLMTFDSLKLSKAVAQCPLPVLTGIGHDINESVLDMVAHRALKTPTAVADFLIEHNLQFESHLLQLGQELKTMVQHRLADSQSDIQQMSQLIHLKSKHLLNAQQRLLQYITDEIPRQAKANVKNGKQQIAQLGKMVELLSPEETLKRGFSISMKNKEVISPSTKLKPGDKIRTLTSNLAIESEILKIDKNEKSKD